MYINPRYTNEVGGILLEQEDGIDLYVDTGEIYDLAVSGEYGTLAAYVSPPEPTAAEILQNKREQAVLTRREFFLAIDAAGMYDAVLALKDNPATPRATVIELDTATEFKRMWPTLVDAAIQLGVTDQQLDTVFGIN